jgi:hypothetical protein
LQEVLDELGDVRLVDVFVRGGRHRRVHAHAEGVAHDPGLFGRLLHHVERRLEVVEEEDFLAEPVHAAAEREEVFVALAGLGGGELRVEGGGHLVDVLPQVDHGAVVVEASPLRVEVDQVAVVGGVSAGPPDDAAEDLGHRDDGGPHVEAVALILDQVHLAAEVAVGLDERDLETLAGELDRGRQARETAADDSNMRTHPLVSSVRVALLRAGPPLA